MSMPLRRLGSSGLKVSAIGLGTNTFGGTADKDATTKILYRAIELGITFVDTADVYGRGRSEEFIGDALVGRRHEVILATKCGMAMGDNPYHRGMSRRWIMEALEASLRRLKTDYVDLYQSHAPDADTPIEETLRAMDDAVQQGKVRYNGSSNYAAWQLARAHGVSVQQGLNPWVSAQNKWNLLEGVDDPTLPAACRELGVGIIPYTPLASGILTGKYRRGEAPAAGTFIPSERPSLSSTSWTSSRDLRPKFLVSSISRSVRRTRSRSVWMLAFLSEFAERTERSSSSMCLERSASRPARSSRPRSPAVSRRLSSVWM